MKGIWRPAEVEVDPDSLKIKYTAPQKVETYSDALVPRENRSYRVDEPSDEVGFVRPPQSYVFDRSVIPSVREVGWGENLSDALSNSALAVGEGIGAGATGALGLVGIGAGATMAGAGQLMRGTGALARGGGKLVLATAEGAGKILKGAGDLAKGIGTLGLGGAAIVGNAIKGAVVGAGEAASKAIVAYNESRNNELEKRYQKETDEKIKLAGQIARITAQLATLQISRSEAQKQIAKYQTELAVKNNRIIALQQELEIAKVQKPKESTRKIESTLKKEVDARKAAETRLQIQERQYANDLEAYNAQIGKLTANNQILTERLTQVTDYANDLQTQIALKQKDIDQLLMRPVEQQIVVQRVPVPGPVQYREVPRIETQVVPIPIKPARPYYRTVKNPVFFETFNPKARQRLKPRKKRTKSTKVFNRIGGF